MKARFKKTRLKGPDDLKRYDDALSAYEDLEGSCEKVKGAETAVAAALAKCEKRSKAQSLGAEGDSCWHEGLEGSP